MFESDKVEYKQMYTDEIKEEVVAFLNTDGGTIFVGIDKNGVVVGCDNPDDTQLRLTSSIRRSIRPDCGLFVRVSSDVMEGKHVVIVNVTPGKNTPYYIGEKGIKPSGVFIRVGTSKVQAQEDEIRYLFDKAKKEPYEDRQSPYANLTFNTAEKIFAEKEISFRDNNKRTLGLINMDTGIYTNLAYLLSDQCEFSVKCSIFKGTEHMEVKNSKEFSGSLFDQIENTINLIDMYNENGLQIGKIFRTDCYDYPPKVIREGILNALIHRDYTVSASTFVKMFDDRLEISSFGGLVHGTTPENMKTGASNPRNPRLCALFHRLGYIEAFGYGIPKIYEAYKNCNKQPEYSLPDGMCTLILPNQRYYGINDTAKQESHNTSTGQTSAQQSTDKKVTAKVQARFDAVYTFLQNNPQITKNEAATLFETKSQPAYLTLEQMVDRGLLRSEIQGKTKVYYLP
ncbi:MAG: putative DNA binding domain-containing protein [Clostridia bacterium]|nr:putative DNA binding domain-containing protein [Clostridia bacterium]